MSALNTEDKIIKLVDGLNTNIQATVLQTSNPNVNPVATQLTDGSGTPITSFGGGTQYTDAGTAAVHPIGTGIIFNNGGTYNFVSALQPLPVTGSLTVGGTTDNSAFTAGTTTGTPAMGFYHSTIDTVTDGRAAALAIDSKRNLFTVLRDAAGNARGVNVTAANELLVSVNNASIAVTGTFWQTTQPVSGTGTFAVQATLQANSGVDIGKLTANQSVNVAQINGVTTLMGNGTTGTGSQRVTIASDNTAFSVNASLGAETTKVIGVVRNSDGAGNLLTSNSITYTAKFGLDNNLLGTLGTAFSTAGKVDIKGADGDVFVRNATAANLLATVSIASAQTLATVTTVGTVTTITNQVDVNLKQVGGTNTLNGGVGGSQSIGGTVATNVAITANPINLGVQAVSSENSAVTTARQVQLIADLVGKLIVLPYANPENFVNGTTAAITDTSTTSIIAAEGAGVRTYITSIIVTNSHATVGTFVKITDGASTILWEGYAAPLGGGFTQSFPVPLKGTANTAVNAICVTTGSNVIVSASGYKGV